MLFFGDARAVSPFSRLGATAVQACFLVSSLRYLTGLLCGAKPSGVLQQRLLPFRAHGEVR